MSGNQNLRPIRNFWKFIEDIRNLWITLADKAESLEQENQNLRQQLFLTQQQRKQKEYIIYEREVEIKDLRVINLQLILQLKSQSRKHKHERDEILQQNFRLFTKIIKLNGEIDALKSTHCKAQKVSGVKRKHGFDDSKPLKKRRML